MRIHGVGKSHESSEPCFALDNVAHSRVYALMCFDGQTLQVVYLLVDLLQALKLGVFALERLELTSSILEL